MPTSIEQWFDALKQHWRLSVVTFLAVMSIAVGVVIFAPRVYRSDAKLILRVGRESVTLDPTATTVGETLSLHATRDHEIKTALGVMESREILQSVVDRVGVDTILKGEPIRDDAVAEDINPVRGAIRKLKGSLASIDPVTPRESALKNLAEGIEIDAANESSVVSIAYQAKSPEVAQSVVDAWLASYLTHHNRVNRATGTYPFFIEQSEVLRQQLEQARKDLQDAKNEINIVTIEGQQKLLEAQLSKVRDGLIDADAEMAALQSRVQAYEQILSSEIDRTVTAETTGKAHEAFDQMRNQLFALEIEEKDLRSKLTPEHPKLLAVQRQLEEAREIVRQQEDGRVEVTQSVNPAHQQLAGYQMLDKATKQGLIEKRAALVAKHDELLQEVAQLNEYERKIAGLQQQVQILDERYARQSEKLEQARQAEVLAEQQITSVNIVQPASFQQRPVSPNKAFCIVAGFMAACAAAISLPMLLHASAQHRRRVRQSHANSWQFAQREQQLQTELADQDSDEMPETDQAENHSRQRSTYTSVR